VFLANGSTDLALDDFEKAIDRDPRHAEAYAGRGLIQARQSRVDAAIGNAELAYTHRGVEPSARLLWNIAHVYAQAAARVKGPRRTEHENRAIAMLDRARTQAGAEKEQIAFWTAFVAPDRLLDPLRGNAKFDALEKEVMSKARRSR
jgi:tetratricopeptide (TPR) repeat protein